jgi:hypothetical protein
MLARSVGSNIAFDRIWTVKKLTSRIIATIHQPIHYELKDFQMPHK